MPARDIRSLDVAMLRTFDALMRERSVSRAAARLFLSQPAVSASLGRLREVFDDPLFRRTGHGVTPTPRALAMAAQVEKLLGELSALVAGDAAFDPATSNRVFRIAGSDFPSQRFLPPLAQRLAAAGSSLRIVWQPPGAGSLAERLERGELDLAVVARVQMSEALESATLYEDAYVYAVRAGHPQAGRPPTLQTFCETPQVFLGYGTSVLDDLIDATLARQGLRRRVQVAVTSFAQIVHLLEHSDHAAVLGSRVAASFGERLCVQPLPFELPGYRALVCWPARTAHDPGLRWLRDQLLDIAAQGG
jgi:DNA-binding transcriptional LysR family regulator